jgi:hypothetical protein
MAEPLEFLVHFCIVGQEQLILQGHLNQPRLSKSNLTAGVPQARGDVVLLPCFCSRVFSLAYIFPQLAAVVLVIKCGRRFSPASRITAGFAVFLAILLVSMPGLLCILNAFPVAAHGLHGFANASCKPL